MESSSSSSSSALKRRRIVIDSRDRDKSKYPDPASYEVPLYDDIENIVSIRLVSADVPLPAFTIPEGADDRFVYVTLDGTTEHRVGLPPGNYTSVPDAAAAFKDALAEVDAAFDVAADARRGALRVTHAAGRAFTLLFQARAAAVLGFAPAVPYFASLNSAAVAAPFCVDLDGGPGRYAILSISPSAEVLMSINNATNRCFAVLYRQSTDVKRCIVHGEPDDSSLYEKVWSTPLARIGKIGIKFTDYTGAPYDFQQQDHVLEFVVSSLGNLKYR